MPDNTEIAEDLAERLKAKEHYFRNAIEGEYTANLLREARFALMDKTTPTTPKPAADAGELAERIQKAVGDLIVWPDSANDECTLRELLDSSFVSDAALLERASTMAASVATAHLAAENEALRERLSDQERISDDVHEKFWAAERERDAAVGHIRNISASAAKDEPGDREYIIHDGYLDAARTFLATITEGNSHAD